ncbi:MAG: hypothetical protein LPJ86_02590 [Caulobacteraceae bacterium]|nr:hypothetical protein [Caulobacteraceae bacterium]MDX5392690.1 hypothetical protein [Caulobacteraceae bacterium]
MDRELLRHLLTAGLFFGIVFGLAFFNRETAAPHEIGVPIQVERMAS